MRIRDRKQKPIESVSIYLPSIITELLNERKQACVGGKISDATGFLKIDHIAWTAYVVAKGTMSGYDREIYRPVNAAILRSVVREYKRCFDALEYAGVVIRGSSYQTGAKSKRVGLTAACWTPVSPFEVTDLKTTQAIRKHFKSVNDRWEYPIDQMGDHLRHLKIRKADATARLERLIADGVIKQRCKKGKKKDAKWTGPVIPPPEWHLARIIDVNEDESDPSIAPSNGRVFSKATNLKSQFRSDLYFEDSESTGVSSIDVVNSQPYLLSLAVRYLDPVEMITCLDGKLNKLEKVFERVFFGDDRSSCNQIFNLNCAEGKRSTHVAHFWPHGIDIRTRRFTEIASNGEFYEELASEVRKSSGKEWDRERAKAATWQILFGKTHHQNESTRLFASLYPEVWSYVNALKSSKHNGCALVLQRFEAWLMLKHVARAFDAYPDLRYFTIHDSFVVPSDQAYKARSIVMAALTDTIGECPKLSVNNH